MIPFFAARGPHLMLDPQSLLDIGPLDVDGVAVAPGAAIPNDGDPRIDHALRGFLFTCGPDHIRHPEPVAGGSGKRYPLHGSFAGHSAALLGLETGGAQARASARAMVSGADGSVSELQREWRIDGASGEVHLHDRLTNRGASSFAPMWMYHMNIGARLFDEDVRLEGAMLDQGGFGWRFGAPEGDIVCVPAGTGGAAELRLGPIAALHGKTLAVRFRTATLPFLQIWRNQRAPADVLGIEPVSHRWQGREALHALGELTMLAPGATRDYALSFAFV